MIDYLWGEYSPVITMPFAQIVAVNANRRFKHRRGTETSLTV